MKRYAYIRVSTKEQNVDRQILALEPYHISKRDIYCDYQSGKDFERPAYQKLLKKLKEGDLLIIKSIDRLGRNYNDILVQWQYITKEIKADIVVLDMELLDTRQKAGNLTGTLIADLEMPDDFEEICQRCEQGELSIRQAAEVLGVSHSTFYRKYRKITNRSVSNSRHFGTSE